MKRLIAIILLCSMVATPAVAQFINPKLGGSPLGIQFGYGNSLSTTVSNIDGAFYMGQAGSKSVAYVFRSPITQTNGTLTCYAYMASMTGSPTNVEMYLWDNAAFPLDEDRPATTSPALATSTLDLTGTTTPTWLTFQFTNVSLAKNSTYWLIVANQTATPESNFPTMSVRRGNFNGFTRMATYVNTDGYLTDTAAQSSDSPVVCKFNDGSIFGNPYVSQVSHSSNSNFRGMRFSYDEDIEVVGFHLAGINLTAQPTYYVYEGANELFKLIPDHAQYANGGIMIFDNQITFEGGKSYDIIVKPAADTSVGAYMYPTVNNTNDDIEGAMIGVMGFVGGSATSSLTYVQGGIGLINLIVNNIPAITGGSVNNILGNVIQ